MILASGLLSPSRLATRSMAILAMTYCSHAPAKTIGERTGSGMAWTSKTVKYIFIYSFYMYARQNKCTVSRD